MYICICYTLIYIYMYIYTCVCVHIYIYIFIYIYIVLIYIYMCVCLCACVQCYTYIIFYTYRGSRKDGIWTAQDKMAYRANVIFWWHLNRWVFQNVPSYIACLTQSIGVCIKEQFKGTQVCHLSVEKHIGQQQPAASFSHLSIGFGGLRWHIKTPQKIAVQNNLSHIGTDSFIFSTFCNARFGVLTENTKMAHPGTSCPRKMKTAAILPFSHRKHYYIHGPRLEQQKLITTCFTKETSRYWPLFRRPKFVQMPCYVRRFAVDYWISKMALLGRFSGNVFTWAASCFPTFRNSWSVPTCRGSKNLLGLILD